MLDERLCSINDNAWGESMPDKRLCPMKDNVRKIMPGESSLELK